MDNHPFIIMAKEKKKVGTYNFTSSWVHHILRPTPRFFRSIFFYRIYYDIPYAWLLSEGNGWIMVDIYIIWVFYSIAYFWSF